MSLEMLALLLAFGSTQLGQLVLLARLFIQQRGVTPLSGYKVEVRTVGRQQVLIISSPELASNISSHQLEEPPSMPDKDK